MWHRDSQRIWIPWWLPCGFCQKGYQETTDPHLQKKALLGMGLFKLVGAPPRRVGKNRWIEMPGFSWSVARQFWDTTWLRGTPQRGEGHGTSSPQVYRGNRLNHIADRRAATFRQGVNCCLAPPFRMSLKENQGETNHVRVPCIGQPSRP